MPYSAYVPCFNNATTVGQALSSLISQVPPPDELLLIDDASLDNSSSIGKQQGAIVINLGLNSGRGAVRAMAMENAHHDFVVCCDATLYLPNNYVSRALDWFADDRVAAVCGPISQANAKSLSDRWRGRHLYKTGDRATFQRNAQLSTGACVVRRTAVLEVGNFNVSLRHSEDSDLGKRLADAGYFIILDPDLKVFSGVSNTIPELLERYWRWYAGVDEDVSIYGYAKQIWFSLKVMLYLDLRDRDVPSILISLVAPHYAFWKSWLRKRRNRVQT